MRAQITYRQGVMLVVAAGLLWSFMGLLIRMVGDVTTWQLLFYRSLGIVPVLFSAIAIRSGGHPIASLRAAGVVGLIGGVSLVFSFACAIFAIQSTTVANAVFLFSATPFLSALLGMALLRERVLPHTWTAIAIALIGIFLMVREGLSAGAGAGNLAALGSGAFFAVFTVLTRWGQMPDQMPTILIGAVLSVAAASTMIGIGGQGFIIPLRSALIAMGMGAIILGIGLSIFALGGRVIPAAEMSLLALIEVILGPVWVWIFLGETASPGIFAGGAVVLAAIIFNTFAGQRLRRRAVAEL